ncbi:hypothetical protein HII31_05880 [Pseudocercospora fuligena]|uniref:DUF1993 domain-containing protein n=1 Tax=Pseudocercospora fuligena TaxID=685502 RepID=A0A8H6RHV3_9PEZI|nr:hypothetical protein HII31_05880 [Pseudocercospora fuligena]
MSQISLYDTTIPVLVRALEQLQKILRKGEQWTREQGKTDGTLLEARIAEDMHPLTFQVQSATNTVKDFLTHVGGANDTNLGDNEKTFRQLYDRIEKTIHLLRGAKRSNFVSADTPFTAKTWPYLDFTAVGYVQTYTLPNFFFHHTTAYDILRAKGVPVGKNDFIGTQDVVKWKL